MKQWNKPMIYDLATQKTATDTQFPVTNKGDATWDGILYNGTPIGGDTEDFGCD